DLDLVARGDALVGLRGDPAVPPHAARGDEPLRLRVGEPEAVVEEALDRASRIARFGSEGLLHGASASRDAREPRRTNRSSTENGRSAGTGEISRIASPSSVRTARTNDPWARNGSACSRVFPSHAAGTGRSRIVRSPARRAPVSSDGTSAPRYWARTMRPRTT